MINTLFYLIKISLYVVKILKNYKNPKIHYKYVVSYTGVLVVYIILMNR